MIFKRLGAIHKNQCGITMIELTMVLLITGIITSGITMTIFQVISGNARTSNHMIAVRQVQNAGYWVSHDAQMAQSIVIGDIPPGEGFPLTLTWTEYDGTVHQIIYTLEDMTGGSKKLQRSHFIDTVPSGTTIVAQYVVPGVPLTNVEFSGGKLTLTVTVTVGTGAPQEASETRIYEITPRPSV